MTINERFGEILKHKGISVKHASSLMNKTEVYIRKLLRPGESFGIEPLKIILNSFPDINTEWLLTGEGNMLKNTSENPEMEVKLPEVPEVDKNNMDVMSSLLSLIKEQGQTIKEMATNKDEKYLEKQEDIKKRIENVQDSLEEQTMQIDALLKKLDEIINQNQSSSTKKVG